MLNVGPDGNGHIPYYSVKYLQETGRWLQKNGESIYGTTYGFVPAQPWGVTTSKNGKLFLHVFNRPKNGKLLLPQFTNAISKVYALDGKKPLAWNKTGGDVYISLPVFNKEEADQVFVVEYKGTAPSYNATAPVTVSNQFEANHLEAIAAVTTGDAITKSITFSHYFGDWKHATCITSMKAPGDGATFTMRVTEPGDYKILLEYACGQESAKQEGSITVNGKEYFFRTLRTSEFEKSAPLLFIKHPVAITHISRPGVYSITVHPLQQGKELFKLKTVIAEPIH